MEVWQGLAPEVKEKYAVVRVVKRTSEKELVLLQNREDGTHVLLRNYPGELPSVYQLLTGKTLQHIPRILAAEQRKKGYYILEEFIEGKHIDSGNLSVAQVLSILQQLCEALSQLHSLAIVHRDVKPDNLLLTEDGQVYLMDLDAARLYKNHVDKDTCMLGTTGFAAPEQFGIVQTDHRADIFALGVTLNVLLTGSHPSKQLCTGWLRRVVLKCTQLDPVTRYQSADAVWRSTSLLKVIFDWSSPAKVRRSVAFSTCAAACVICVILFNPIFTSVQLPVADTNSDSSKQETQSSNSTSASSESGSIDSSSSSKGSLFDELFGLSSSQDKSSSGSKRPDSPSQPSSNAEPSQDAGGGNTGSVVVDSSSKPTSSSSSTSSKPNSSSSTISSSSSKPSSSSTSPTPTSKPTPTPKPTPKPTPTPSAPPASSSKPSPEEEEIRAAIAEYKAAADEYEQWRTKSLELYTKWQGMYGYQLDIISARTQELNQEAREAMAAADEAQARADAYGAQDPPDLEAQAQAQAEADSYTQLAEQKTAEANASSAEWQALYEQPEAKSLYEEHLGYARKSHAAATKANGLKDRVTYLQNLYGIYLM